jgi:hypothetical protein
MSGWALTALATAALTAAVACSSDDSNNGGKAPGSDAKGLTIFADPAPVSLAAPNGQLCEMWWSDYSTWRGRVGVTPTRSFDGLTRRLPGFYHPHGPRIGGYLERID